MPISKTANDTLMGSVGAGLRSASKDRIGGIFNALSYGMGMTSAGGAATGMAASSVGHHLAENLINKLKFLPGWARTLGTFAYDFTLGQEVMNKAQQLGDKYIPIKWNKNRLPFTYENN